MVKFTQQQLDELCKIAVEYIRNGRDREYKGLFVEMQGSMAVFGVWLVCPPHVKVGFPRYIKVSKSGRCVEIKDYDERIRLLDALNLLRNNS